MVRVVVLGERKLDQKKNGELVCLIKRRAKGWKVLVRVGKRVEDSLRDSFNEVSVGKVQVAKLHVKGK